MSELDNGIDHDTATRNPIDHNYMGVFLKPGWWFVHIVAIIALLYLGSLFWPMF